MQNLENVKSGSESDILENLKTHIKIESYIPSGSTKHFTKTIIFYPLFFFTIL